jgi:IS5 family transposase
VSVCKTSEHETNHLQEFLSPDTQEVYADKGYTGNREAISARGIKDGIMRKGSRGHPQASAVGAFACDQSHPWLYSGYPIEKGMSCQSGWATT